jgi:hypothetical protein
VLVTGSTDALNEVSQLQKEAKPARLDVNSNKTIFIKNIKNNSITNKVILNEVPYEEVPCFKYLASIVTYCDDVMVEIKKELLQVTAASTLLRV